MKPEAGPPEPGREGYLPCGHRWGPAPGIRAETAPFADCELWGPIAYDLILSKEAARLKNYDCPWSGGGFDGIIAPDLSTANTLVKSWLIHAHAVTCGAVVGARVPIALTSRSANRGDHLSLVFCAVLDAWRKKQRGEG